MTEAPTSSLRGIAAIVVLTLVAAVALYSQRPQSHALAGASALAAGAERPALAGFDAGAWYLPDDELLGFVEIPGGPFLMGSDPVSDRLAYDNERPAEGPSPIAVDVPAFYIGRYEVTVAQFRAFVEATGHRAAAQALAGPPTHPVTSVSWPDVLGYCRWLEATLKQSPRTPARLKQRLEEGWRVTLPTEAEWEKAARGTDGRIFPWGDRPRRDRANYGGAGTAAVGSFPCPECPFPVFDMSGNVWEWTRSPYSATLPEAAGARGDLASDALWVMRGGSFMDPERHIRAAVRGGGDPGARRPFIGFRVAISSGPGAAPSIR